MPASAISLRSATAPLPSSSLGVLDIGSNSLRLVLYDQLGRAPTVLLNEKVMCALGRGLNRTGRLNPDGVALARDNIERFVLLAERLGIGRLDILATAAVRDAADGPGFVAEIEARCGVKVTVIDGEREGHLSALGVRSGIPDADGLCGDLGGGSLELATVGPGAMPRVATLPIGPLRLMEASGDQHGPRQEIDRAVASVEWLKQGSGRPFYAVGGAWRALARVHMDQTRYPLHIIQNYAIPRAEAESFLTLIDRQSRRSLEKLIGFSRRRLEIMPLAAHVLSRLMSTIEPSALVFSVYGLREGHLFDQLSERQRQEDPLLTSARQIAASNRFGTDPEELCDWSGPIVPDETPAARRLRLAAAILSDIGWNEHPDYRAEQSFTRCLRMPIPGIDHAARVSLATILSARYGGNLEAPWVLQVRPLIDDAAFMRARAMGLAFRLGYTISGGAPGVLGQTRLIAESGRLILSVPELTALFSGEAVHRRLEALARTLGKRAEIALAG